MEIIAITGILGTLAVITLVVLRPWDGLGRLAALALFFTPRPRPRHAGSPRTPQQVWDDGPVPPVGSMDYDAELKYRAMAGLPPPPDPLAEHLRRSGAELTAKLDAQRAAWAEPRPAVLLVPPDDDDSGPEWPPDGPGGGAQPPGPAGRTDGASAPPGAWRGQFDALAPPEPDNYGCDRFARNPVCPQHGDHPYPLPGRPWQPRSLPPWATEGGTWQIPGGTWQIPPGAFLEPLPPGGDALPGICEHDFCDDPAGLSGCPVCHPPSVGPPGGDRPPEDDGPIYRPDGLDIADPDPPGTVVIGPGADVPGCPCSACAHDGCWGCPCHDDDEPEPEPPALACAVDHGGQPCPGYPEPAEPSRLADPGELFRAELASEVLADIRARDADTARYLDRQAADLATTVHVMIRGLICQTNT